MQKNTPPSQDPISELQKLAQARTRSLPHYNIIQTDGADHAPNFQAMVAIPDENIRLKATGKSKKEAQKAVAELALIELANSTYNPGTRRKKPQLILANRKK